MGSSSINPPNTAAFQQGLPKCLSKHLILEINFFFNYQLYSHLLSFGRDLLTLGFFFFFPLKDSEKLLSQMKRLLLIFNRALKARRKKMHMCSSTVFVDEKWGFFFPLAAVFSSPVLSLLENLGLI